MKNFIHKFLLFNLLTSIIFTINIPNVSAQFFDSNQNPPGLKWNQIDTENFQIIYPVGLETESQRMANTLNSIIEKVSLSYKIKPRKISVILQNQGTSSNGFVQLAPRRSEFYTTPGQEFDYQDWLNSLAVHELRHVAQFDKLTGKLKPPFEELALAIFGITLPPWFYEGDAVGIETSLTNAGRGRQPGWNMILRANILTDKNFSYSKDYIGSLQNFTPGYYQLGYFMTTKLRRDYGVGIMDSLLTRIAKNPIRPYNLSRSINSHTGINTRQLHDSTTAELKKIWQQELDQSNAKNYPSINVRKNTVATNYLLPFYDPQNGIIALKQGLGTISTLISIDEKGSEKNIFKIGLQEEPYFHYAANKIVWDEFRYDKRFQKRSFNVINIYDLKSNTARQLTHKTRLFAPCLSPDGKIIAAIDVSYSNRISIVELDAVTGKEIARYFSPNNYMLQTARFNDTGGKIVVVAVSKQGKTLFELNRIDKTFNQLLPFQSQLISKPAYAGNSIIFKANFNGIDNIYKLDPTTKNTYQLTSVNFGAANPFYDSATNTILFNNYQPDGYDISSIPFNQTMEPISDYHSEILDNYINPVVAQEGNINVFDSISDRKYASKSFKETSNLFYFHSLEPILESNNNDNYTFGLKLKSDNKLNTLSFYTGYQFNNALKKSEYLAGFTYSRFYPVFAIDYINQAKLFYYQQSNKIIPLSWREHQIEANVTIPFTINRFNNIYRFGIKAGTSYTSRYNAHNQTNSFISSLDFPMHYQGYFRRNTIYSARDLAPLWGQNITLDYFDFPFDNRANGRLFTLKSTFYFPGLATHHSLQASFNYQNGVGDYGPVNDIPLVSGYNNINPTVNLRNTLLFDYRFPLFYPDWQIGPIAYIKRIKAGFFADFENIGKGNLFSPRTFGAELRADLNLLRFYLPNFDLGGKLIFVNEKSQQNPIFEASLIYNY